MRFSSNMMRCLQVSTHSRSHTMTIGFIDLERLANEFLCFCSTNKAIPTILLKLCKTLFGLKIKRFLYRGTSHIPIDLINISKWIIYKYHQLQDHRIDEID